jgi:hypothetical protein
VIEESLPFLDQRKACLIDLHSRRSIKKGRSLAALVP